MDNQQNEKILISWTAQEFTRKEKNLAWLISLGAIALVFFVIGLLMKNYIFLLIIILSSFLVFIQALRHPQKIKTEIFEEKITVNDQLKIPFKDITSFWIFEETDVKTLCLETKKLSRLKVYLPLGQQSPDEIRQILTGFIKEKKQEESLIDLVARRLRF